MSLTKLHKSYRIVAALMRNVEILKARNMKVLLVANTCEETEQILLNMTALPKLQTRTDLKPLLAGQPTTVSE